jgi:hypothetical protein
MNQYSSRRFALIRSLRITLAHIEAAFEFERDDHVLSELKRIIIQRIADMERAEDEETTVTSIALAASEDQDSYVSSLLSGKLAPLANQ